MVDVSDKSETILTDNAVLAVADAAFRKPDTTYTTVVASAGVELNVRELRPPLMDLSGRTKYPILFQVYGGPASQLVNVGYTRDYHHYLCTSLNYIVVTVDPRGTGFKGRDFRTPVRERLGELEALDVVNAARVYAALPYVDEDRVGVWGWVRLSPRTNARASTDHSAELRGVPDRQDCRDQLERVHFGDVGRAGGGLEVLRFDLYVLCQQVSPF